MNAPLYSYSSTAGAATSQYPAYSYSTGAMQVLGAPGHAAAELPGIGKADHCQAAGTHRPRPLRFVWHHILPLACGGKTVAANLAQVCDNCHYTIHILMWQLANGGLVSRGGRGQTLLARQGYALATAAGTTGQIPREA